MSRRTIELTEPLYQYLLAHGVREHPALARLRAETAAHPQANMQIAPEQGAFMQLLVRLIGARRCLEVGTFTGYSSLAVALALPADGRLTTCDVSAEFTAIAERHWREAGVAGRIELKLAPALDTLAALVAAGAAGSFDFAFIDGDKANYPRYAELAIQLLRAGGLLAVDNVLWDGKVADAAVRDADTAGIRALNAMLKSDPRVEVSLVPIADGLYLALKR